MFSNILITCIGNICRSPMAEELFRQKGQAQLSYAIEVRSAGTHALVEHSADSHAEELMTELGLDITQHRAQKLNAELANWADIILVMDLEQKRYIEGKHQSTRGKVFRLLENDGADIPDPYKRGMESFKAALVSIQKGTDEWIEKIS
ncbi:MAG: low molecular weight phosphotyrosine protein phosphatase [Pseudomonadales bacterium]|nr:low molecular weight phosphotyrosine protein phosphatase [Pseudomonadales bacterium]